MPGLVSMQIVEKAFESDELDLMLLGRPPYAYRPRWSPSPEGSDITILLGALYDGNFSFSREEALSRLNSAIGKLLGTYDGLIPVASCVLFETVRRSCEQVELGLPLEAIANLLDRAIRENLTRLAEDKNGIGSQWLDGKLGELRCLSQNCQKRGGPAFV